MVFKHFYVFRKPIIILNKYFCVILLTLVLLDCLFFFSIHFNWLCQRNFQLQMTENIFYVW